MKSIQLVKQEKFWELFHISPSLSPSHTQSGTKCCQLYPLNLLLIFSLDFHYFCLSSDSSRYEFHSHLPASRFCPLLNHQPYWSKHSLQTHQYHKALLLLNSISSFPAFQLYSSDSLGGHVRPRDPCQPLPTLIPFQHLHIPHALHIPHFLQFQPCPQSFSSNP